MDCTGVSVFQNEPKLIDKGDTSYHVNGLGKNNVLVHIVASYVKIEQFFLK